MLILHERRGEIPVLTLTWPQHLPLRWTGGGAGMEISFWTSSLRMAFCYCEVLILVCSNEGKAMVQWRDIAWVKVLRLPLRL